MTSKRSFEDYLQDTAVPAVMRYNKISFVPMINAVGASVICLSPYSPDFNPIELWWSQLKSFLRMFAPTTTSMIDRIIAVALHLMNPQHLRNWFASCCYCTS